MDMDQTTLRQALVALGFAGGLTLSVCPSLAGSAQNDDADEQAGKDEAARKDKRGGDDGARKPEAVR